MKDTGEMGSGERLARTTFNRRRALGLAAGATAMLGLGSVLGPSTARPAQAAGDGIEALVLTCIDYRFQRALLDHLGRLGLTDDYDPFVLAGASLGPQQDQFPSWRQTWWDHVAIAQELHQIRRIIVLDHRDCGAYRIIVGPDYDSGFEAETAYHQKYLTSLRAEIWERYPDLEIDLGLIDLDENIAIVP